MCKLTDTSKVLWLADYFVFFFFQKKTSLYYMMAPKKARKNPRKIEINTDTPLKFEWGNTTADIQKGVGDGNKEEKNRIQRAKKVRMRWKLKGKQVYVVLAI